MRFVTASLAVILIVTACTAAQLEEIDPVVDVAGVYCPDRNGNPQPLIAGYVCCSWQGMGPGQCPEGYSCMNTDSCTATPLPPNDAYGARVSTKRRGF
jgi:hypothetical protein